MTEIIKHLFGLCGEGHPSILFFTLTPLMIILSNIKKIITFCALMVSTYLR